MLDLTMNSCSLYVPDRTVDFSERSCCGIDLSPDFILHPSTVNSTSQQDLLLKEYTLCVSVIGGEEQTVKLSKEVSQSLFRTSTWDSLVSRKSREVYSAGDSTMEEL